MKKVILPGYTRTEGTNRAALTRYVLAACITLPYMASPFIARRIDTAHDSRRIIAEACIIHTVIIVAATLTFSHVPERGAEFLN